jgi:hypothetical protein
MHPARRASGAERVKYFLVINNFVEQSSLLSLMFYLILFAQNKI